VSSEEAYALYYDLLYSHRDVAREVDFLERVFSQCSQVSVRRVLDVGCGTGIHSIELARRGYEVLGVDLSQKMIEVAREKSRAAGVTGVYFLQADATRLEFEEEFDAVIAMYGVISYFTCDENLLEFLRSLRRALKKGGVFVFDTWNLTGVLYKRVFYETPSTSIRKSGSMLAIKEEVWRVDALDQVAHAEIKVVHRGPREGLRGLLRPQARPQDIHCKGAGARAQGNRLCAVRSVRGLRDAPPHRG
jgi:SAM-dependent methyltransferase